MYLVRAKCSILKNFLFRNNYRFIGHWKGRSYAPFTPIPPVVTSYITIAQYQNQEQDIGITNVYITIIFITSVVLYNHHSKYRTVPSPQRSPSCCHYIVTPNSPPLPSHPLP